MPLARRRHLKSARSSSRPNSNSFSIDFGDNEDASADNEKGKTIGLAAVQDIEDFGTELRLRAHGRP